MESRRRKLANQLGKRITDPGAHMPHVVVGLLRKKRSKKADLKENIKAGSKVKPMKSENPFPMESLPGSM